MVFRVSRRKKLKRGSSSPARAFSALRVVAGHHDLVQDRRGQGSQQRKLQKGLPVDGLVPQIGHEVVVAAAGDDPDDGPELLKPGGDGVALDGPPGGHDPLGLVGQVVLVAAVEEERQVDVGRAVGVLDLGPQVEPILGPQVLPISAQILHDRAPDQTAGPVGRGVQKMVGVVELLPPFVGEDLAVFVGEVVVREDQGQVLLPVHHVAQDEEDVLVEHVVPVQPDQVAPPGLAQGQVADPGQPQPLGGDDPDPGIAPVELEDLGGLVAGVVVDDQKLPVVHTLAQDRLDGLGEEPAHVVGGDVNAESGVLAHGASLTGRP